MAPVPDSNSLRGRQPCGVVVTYHPDAGFAGRLRVFRDECAEVVVVDNGSGGNLEEAVDEIPGVALIALHENLGVAAALNRGAAWAQAKGHGWIVTLDQDSLPRPGMVTAMSKTAARYAAASIVGPRIVDTVRGRGPYRWVRRPRWWPLGFERVPCETEDLPEVTSVITSGSLVSLDLWRLLGGFDEGLFIDYVDNDFCLRAIAVGQRVCVSHEAFLEHRLGERTRHSALGHEFRPTHHSALRHYYMARNRITLWRRHATRFPHWALFDLTFALYNYFRVAVFEAGRWRKFRAVCLGTWDGLHGKCGKCPASRQRELAELWERTTR